MEKLLLWFKSLFSNKYAAPGETSPEIGRPSFESEPAVAEHTIAKMLLSVQPPDYVSMAMGLVGISEANNISQIKRFFDYTSYPKKYVTNTTAWCAAFICMLMAKYGYKNSKSAAAAGQEKLGESMPLTSPYGVCVWEHMNGSMRGRKHTNIALEAPLSWTPRAVKCVGGNQGNKCSIAYYGTPNYRLVAYRKPVKL